MYHLIGSAPYFLLWLDQPVFKTLIIALRMMMSQAIHQNIPDSTELRGGGCPCGSRKSVPIEILDFFFLSPHLRSVLSCRSGCLSRHC